jgi:hypothetical protein
MGGTGTFIARKALDTERDVGVYFIQDVTERCGQILGKSSTNQNEKNCPYQHVSGNIQFVGYS